MPETSRFSVEPEQVATGVQEAVYFPETGVYFPGTGSEKKNRFRVRTFMDDAARTEVISDNEQVVWRSPEEEKSTPFVRGSSPSRLFYKALDTLGITPLLFAGILAACCAAGALASFLLGAPPRQNGSVDVLLEKANAIERYLERDEQRELQHR
jgi:hypothetical protein